MTKPLEEILKERGITNKNFIKILNSLDKPTELENFLTKYDINKKELDTILKSSNVAHTKRAKIDIPDKHIRIGYFSDPHIGHDQFRVDDFEQMIKHFKKEGVDFIVCAGDHLEGMSGRPGHIYELTHIGFTNQIKYATDLYNMLDVPILGIDGKKLYKSWSR